MPFAALERFVADLSRMLVEGVNVGEERLLDGQPESRLIDLRPGGAEHVQQPWRTGRVVAPVLVPQLHHDRAVRQRLDQPHDVIVSDGSVQEAGGELRLHGAELPGPV